jgi:hypothetical protein
MTRDDVLEFCTGLAGAVEDYPFGDEVAVFKVGGKVFALVMLSGREGFVNLKCDPDLALELRARHSAVRSAQGRRRHGRPGTTPTSGTGTASTSTARSTGSSCAR